MDNILSHETKQEPQEMGCRKRRGLRANPQGLECVEIRKMSEDQRREWEEYSVWKTNGGEQVLRRKGWSAASDPASEIRPLLWAPWMWQLPDKSGLGAVLEAEAPAEHKWSRLLFSGPHTSLGALLTLHSIFAPKRIFSNSISPAPSSHNGISEQTVEPSRPRSGP